MEKRAAGTPLSEAEHQQRVEAARSRWEKVAGAFGAAGAGVTGAAGAAAAARLIERRKAAGVIRAGEAKAKEQRAWGALAAERIAARAKKQTARARAGDVVPKYRQFLERRVREGEKDLAALDAGGKAPHHRNSLGPEFASEGAAPASPRQIRDAISRRNERWRTTLDRLQETPGRRRVKVSSFERKAAAPHTRQVKVSVSGQAVEARAAHSAGITRTPAEQQRIESAKRLLEFDRDRTGPAGKEWRATVEQAKRRLHAAGELPDDIAPPRSTGKKKVVPVEPIAGASVRTHTRLLPRAWPTKADAKSWRGEMALNIAQSADWAGGEMIMRAGRRARATRAASIGQAKAILAALPARARAAGAAGAALGTALGALAAWRATRPVEKLSKAGPRGSAQLVGNLASRLAGLFQAWGQNPAQPDAEAEISRAIEPAQDAFLLGASSVLAPVMQGDSTQAPPSGLAPRHVIAVSFDARNPRVQQFLHDYSLNLIRSITDESRQAVRTALQLGAMTGASIPEQARLVRQSIGLSPGQVAWVQSYRMQLKEMNPAALNRSLRDARFDGTVQRAIKEGKPLTDDQIERMVDAYSRRTLAYRATTIARTEGLRAATEGSLAQVRAMLEADNTLDVEKTWMTADDDRVRHEHQELNGEKVIGLETAFLVRDAKGATQSIRYPRDPMAAAHLTVGCRCELGLRLVPRADARREFVAEAV